MSTLEMQGISSSDDPDNQQDVRRAIENVLKREAISASKEERAPQ